MLKMNANELADELNAGLGVEFYEENTRSWKKSKIIETAIMLRQQQTEIARLRESKKEDVAEIYKLKSEIEVLKSGGEAVAEFKFPDAEDYVGDYEMDCDEGIYHPSDEERFLIADALMGYISDLPKLYTHPADLTDDEIDEVLEEEFKKGDVTQRKFARAILRKAQEK
jgi:hypothetical protein